MLDDGELIVESTWEITADRENPVTLVEGTEGTGINQGLTGIYLEGGTAGIQYTLTNKIVTANATAGITRVESKSGVINCCLR